MISVFLAVENIVEKKQRKCWFHFLSFCKDCPNSSFIRVLKTQGHVKTGLKYFPFVKIFVHCITHSNKQYIKKTACIVTD